MKSKLQLFAGLISLLVTLPIWYYLQYKILEIVNASELMWFLFWIYLPVGVIMAILNKFVENMKE